MTRLKAILATFAVLIGGIAGAVAIESPAAAAYADCLGGEICMFMGHDGVNPIYHNGPNVGPGCWDIGGNWDNNTYSWENNRFNAIVLLYTSHGCHDDNATSTYRYKWALQQFSTVNFSYWDLWLNGISSYRICSPPIDVNCNIHG